MGRAAKTRAKEKRAKEKRGRKAAKKAQYEAWRDQGINNKSKRARLNSKRKKKTVMANHPNGRCYNIGCMKCSSLFAAELPDGKKGILHWMVEQKNERRAKLGLPPIKQL